MRRRKRNSLPRGHARAKIAPLSKLCLLRVLASPLFGGALLADTDGWLEPILRDAGCQTDADGAWLGGLEALRLALEEHLFELEADTVPIAPPETLSSNIARLAALAGLSDTEQHVLAILVLLDADPVLRALAIRQNDWDQAPPLELLSLLFDLPQQLVSEILSPRGALASSGLVTCHIDNDGRLRDYFEFMTETFCNQLTTRDLEPVEILEDLIKSASPATLAPDDFAYLADDLEFLLAYLRVAHRESRKGVNIFIYGPPGTGKSQLARVIALEVGAPLLEVASMDKEEKPLDGQSRLSAYRGAQCFLRSAQPLVLFDEAEDAFDAPYRFSWHRRLEISKAWMNRMLEDNRAPTIWLSNSAAFDPAFLRRFDIVMELPVPSRRQRQRVLHMACKDFLPAEEIRRFAASDELAPAVVTRAAAVVRAVGDTLSPAQRKKAFAFTVGGVLAAQGHAPIRLAQATISSETYDLDFLNTDPGLAALAQQLPPGVPVRLCLAGPPGTGKSAFGRWLAERLDQPLLIVRGSDLLSKYIGDSEKAIAKAFRNAEADGAVLLIDEVEGLLLERTGQSAWLVTMVNELLTAMEAFEGVFVATTNMADRLDPAALRRFDLKVTFHPLDPGQAWLLLQRHCQAAGLGSPSGRLRTRLATLTDLTPGDFATVARQAVFRPISNAAAFVSALEAECSFKAPRLRRVGFI